MITSNDCWLTENCKRLHCQDPNGCLILQKLDYLYTKANVPLNLRKKQILVTDKDHSDNYAFKELKGIQDNILNFIENGNQLYLFSSQAGNGKTSWSLRLLQTYFNKIWLKTDLSCKALFINVPSFLIALKDNFTNKSEYIQNIKDNINNCDLVIWDDIGNKIGTQFEVDNLLSMIDTRINNKKCNIYTSNINPNILSDYLDIRLASRIINKSKIIELKGGDKRGLSLSK